MHRKAGRGLPGERYFFGGGVSGGGGGARDIESWRRIGKDGESRKKNVQDFLEKGGIHYCGEITRGGEVVGIFYD